MPRGKSHGDAYRRTEKQIIQSSLLLTEQAAFTKCAVSFYKHPLFSGSSIQQQAYGIVRAWNILDATGFLDENAKKIDINDHINTTLYEEALHPVIYTLSVVPAILLAPFVLMMAPTLRMASIILIVYSTVWATLFATITGIQTIDKTYLDKAATLELKGLKKFFKVILPAASPTILGGFVNALRNTFIMLVYAEMYGATSGMGYYVKLYSDFGLFNKVWMGFIFMVIILVVVMTLFEKLKTRLLKWTIN